MGPARRPGIGDPGRAGRPEVAIPTLAAAFRDSNESMRLRVTPLSDAIRALSRDPNEDGARVARHAASHRAPP